MTMETETTADDLARHVQRVSGLSIDSDFSEVINAKGLIGEAKRRLAELQEQVEAVAVEIIQRDGEQTIGEIRYFAGPTKSYHGRNLRQTVEAVFQASGGDWDKFVDCLSASAMKPGAVRDLFEEAGSPRKFVECFEVRETMDLKTGKPKLQSINPKFVK